jgi:uncharacterized protein YbjT (DUF2867 family)
MRIAITTPTGHVGLRTVQQLLPAHIPITVLARDPARLASAVRENTRVVTGALDEAAALDRLLDEADALLYVVPPNYTAPDYAAWQLGLGRTAADAVRRNGVARVVFLSSSGAQRSDAGPVTGLGEIEGMFRRAAPHVVALRPGYFMENVLMAVPAIASQGTIYNALPADLRLPTVATRDVGDVAARYLCDSSWSGHHVVGVHGPADLSQNDIAAAVARALGRPIKYVPVALDAFGATLRETGASPSVVATYLAMTKTLSSGSGWTAEPRTTATTTPTTIAEFAATVIAPAVAAAAPAAAR